MANNWITAIQKAFKHLGCIDYQKVHFATFMLTKDAKRWWETRETIFTEQVKKALTAESELEEMMKEMTKREGKQNAREPSAKKHKVDQSQGIKVGQPKQQQQQFNTMCKGPPEMEKKVVVCDCPREGDIKYRNGGIEIEVVLKHPLRIKPTQGHHMGNPIFTYLLTRWSRLSRKEN
ncbi:hypothetical protein ACLOJK_028375 [Asimina triloba]